MMDLPNRRNNEGMKPEEVRRIRTQLGLSQEAFADLIGLSSWKVLSNIELGYRKPNQLAVTIMRALDDLPSKKVQELLGLLRKYGEK
jgi:DNA-binding transcriptional regulator YiaG